MTNREWIESLPDDEYDKQVGLNYTKCQWCAFWSDGQCRALAADTCTRGRVLWLKAEHKE